MAKITRNSMMEVVTANEKACAVIDKYFPGFISKPEMKYIRGIPLKIIMFSFSKVPQEQLDKMKALLLSCYRDLEAQEIDE